METIELSKFEKQKPSAPYAIYFVYAPNGKFIVKGMCEEVRRYVKERFTRCFFRYTYWKSGISRGGWGSTVRLYIRSSPNDILSLSDIYLQQRGKKYISMVTSDGYKRDFMIVRRVPHKWLPEFDKAISK